MPKGADGTWRRRWPPSSTSRQTDQLAAADDLLNRLIAGDPANANNADLWRLAAGLAERRQRPARAAACLETALDLEYRDLPPVIDLQAWRSDYGKLLSFYQTQATTLADAHATPPAAWPPARSGPPIAGAPTTRKRRPPARRRRTILRRLGADDAAWEYLTTPAASAPGAVSWTGTAQELSRRRRRGPGRPLVRRGL